MCLTLLQYLLVGQELYLANKFTTKDLSGLVLIVRYISAPIALRYSSSEQEDFHAFYDAEIDPFWHLSALPPSGYSWI